MTPSFSKRRGGFTLFDLVVVTAFGSLLTGLWLPALQSARQKAARTRSANNLKRLGLAVNNFIGANNGKVAPSYGEYGGTKNSLFYNLTPFLEGGVQGKDVTETKAPALKVLEAPLDISNPGGQGLTSYCSNASVFGGAGGPKVPMTTVNILKYFNQKGSTNLLMFGERYAELNKVWSSQKCYIYGATKGSEIQFNVTPKTAKDSQSPGYCQAFTSAGCCVGFGDGSVRYINNVGANPTTNFVLACEPSFPKATDVFTSDW